MGYQLNLKASSTLGVANVKGSVYHDGTYLWVRDSSLYCVLFDGTSFTTVDSINQGGTPYAIYGDGTYIYISLGTSVRVFRLVGATIEWVNSAFISPGFTVYSIYCDPAGYIHLFGTGGTLAAYTFDGSTFTLRGSVATGATGYKVIGAGSAIIIGNLSANQIQAYTFDGVTYSAAGFAAFGSYAANSLAWDNNYLYSGSQSAANPDYRIFTYAGGVLTQVGSANIAVGDAYSLAHDGTFLYCAEEAARVVSLQYTLAGGLVQKSVYTDTGIPSVRYQTLCLGAGYIFYCSGNNVKALKNEAIAQFTTDKTQVMSGETVQFTAI